MDEIVKCYVEGLCWVMAYYYQGCVSWKWFYPFHYAPMSSDFTRISNLEIKFERSVPFKAYEQLLSVLPAASKSLIPQPFHWLMTDSASKIHDFYPDDFPIDLNGKKFVWQGVVLLPFIDETRLIQAVEQVYSTLSAADLIRNEIGVDLIFMSSQLSQRVVDENGFKTEISELDSKLFSCKVEELRENCKLVRFTGFLSQLHSLGCCDGCSCYLYGGLELSPDYKFLAKRLAGAKLPQPIQDRMIDLDKSISERD